MNGLRGNPYVEYVLDSRSNEIGEWHFAEATIDRASRVCSIFCDGELRQSQVVWKEKYELGTKGFLCIGEQGGRNLHAKVKGLQLWNRALTAEELRRVSKWDEPDQLVSLPPGKAAATSSAAAC